MSRRKTVSINLEFIQPKIKDVCRSYTVFCEMMGRPNQRTWVTEWNRGKNLPSPEEAAKMCEILSVEPEDILVKLEDIKLVKELIMQKEKPTVKDDGPSAEDIKLLLSKMSESDLWDLFNDVQKEIRGRSSDV